jgi:Na+/H+-dicarboxylate symporter
MTGAFAEEIFLMFRTASKSTQLPTTLDCASLTVGLPIQ